MANCPECGAFNWDNQTVCESCGLDLTTSEKPSSVDRQRPEPLPMHKRTPIGQKRGRPREAPLRSVHDRDLTKPGSDTLPEYESREVSTRRRTRAGQIKGNLDNSPYLTSRGYTRGFGKLNTNAFTIGEIFSEALTVIVKNPIILVPSLIPIGWSITAAVSGIIGFSGLFDLGDEDVELDTIITGFALWAVLSLLISFWAYAATIRMFAAASEKKGLKLLADGIMTSLERTFTLLIGGFIFLVIVVIGGILFVIPGIIAFLLLFMFVQAIMIDDAGPMSSLSKSMDVVRANLGTAIIIFLAILIIPITIEVQSSLVSALPLWATWGNVLVALFSLAAQVYVIGLTTMFYLSRR